MISIAAPAIDKEEIKAVNDVLKSGMLAQGPKVAELEAAFAKYCGTKYALAVNSGTAAIHAALFACGIGPGDEVITTPFSFIATINPILMLGASPVLVDIDPTTFNIDASKIEKAITKKTKAIVPVHLYGQTCDMNAIKKLAKKYDLKIVEDACQAVGAEYRGKKAGNLGDLGCFSLYATKNIMSGEGGVVTTNSKAYAEAIRRFRQHGMNTQYNYEHIGYNYRMSDLHAAIATQQLKKVNRFNKARQKNAKALDRKLTNIPGLVLPTVSPKQTHVYHQYTLRVTPEFPMSRDKFVQTLRDKGIGAGVYYPKPLTAFGHIAKLGYKQNSFPEAQTAAEQCVSLPIHPKVTKADIDIIASTIKSLATNGK